MKNRYKRFVIDTYTDQVFEENEIAKMGGNEKSYLKSHKITLAKIIFDTAGTNLRQKMLAVLIMNTSEKNVIPFGHKRIIEYFIKDYSKEAINNSFDYFINVNFIKEISDKRLMINPEYLSFGSANRYIDTVFIYNSIKKLETRAGGRSIKNIGDNINCNESCCSDYLFA